MNTHSKLRGLASQPDAPSTPGHPTASSTASRPARRGMGRVIAAGVVACLALAAGISWGWFNRGVEVISSIDLDRTVGVAYFAPQRTSILPWENNGILAFVYDDGSYHMVGADALNGAQPVWVEDTLFIPGDRHTRLITAADGHAQADEQNAPDDAAGLDMTAALNLPNGHFEAYSSGNGNVSMAVTSSGGTVANGDATGNTQVSYASGTLDGNDPGAVRQLGYAACGDDVYALIYEPPSPNETGAVGTSTLLRVAADGAVLESNGTAVQPGDTTHGDGTGTSIGELLMSDVGGSSDMTALASTAACDAGVFSILTAQSAGNGSGNDIAMLSLDSWNTVTGRHATKALTGTDGSAFTLSNADLPQATAAAGNIAHDGSLYWFTASRTLNRTALSDGSTRVVSDAYAFGGTSADRALATWFDAGRATAFSTTPGDAPHDSDASRGDAELIAVDTSSGDTLGLLHVQGLDARVKQFNRTMALQGFAANPSYRWPAHTS